MDISFSHFADFLVFQGFVRLFGLFEIVHHQSEQEWRVIEVSFPLGNLYKKSERDARTCAN